MRKNKLLSIAEQLEVLAAQIRLSMGEAEAKPFEITGEPRSAAEVSQMVAESICLRCSDKITGKPVRGDHAYCARIIVASGVEAKAIEYGYILPQGKRGPKPKPLLPGMVADASTDVAKQMAKAQKLKAKNRK